MMDWRKKMVGRSLGVKLPYLVVGLLLFTAVFADFIANDIPIYAKVEGEHRWPLFTAMFSEGTLEQSEWKQGVPHSTAHAVYPPIAFSVQSATDLKIRYQKPLSIDYARNGQPRHWLGTDRLGRDIAAGIVHGCRSSVLVGLLAMVIAGIIGVLLGAMAGYWGNHTLRINPIVLGVAIVGLLYVGFLTFYQSLSVSGGILTALFLIGGLSWLSALYRFRTLWPLPLDAMVLRIIEVLQSLPALLILLVFGAMIARPSLAGLAVIIGALRWTSFAKFTRAEVMKIKKTDYVTAARIAGQTDWQRLVRYILPQTLGPLVVVFAFGIASVILLESTLSFLGIGVPIGQLTWGSMLGQARLRIDAWWLAVFPGLAIFITVVSINTIGDRWKAKWQVQD